MDLNKLRKKLNDANTSTGSKPKTSSKSSKGVSGQPEKLKNSLSSLQDRAERSQMDRLRGMASEAAGKNTRRTVTDANRRTLTSTASSNRDISGELNVLRDRLRERLGNQPQMPVTQDERRMTDFSGIVGGYNSIMDSMEGLRNADLPEPRQTRRSTPGYTGGVLEAEDRLQLNRTLLDVYDASAPLRNRTYESVPVYGRELTQDETDAALTRLDADIAAARESGAPQGYIDILVSARDDFAANPSQYRDLNLEQSWEVAEAAAPDGKRDTLVQGIRNAEEDLWMRQQANRWSLAAQRAARDGWDGVADMDAWREDILEEQNAVVASTPDIYNIDVRRWYTQEEASLYEYLRKHGNPGEADEYANYMQPIAAQRRNAYIAEETADSSFLERTLTSVVTNPMKIMQGVDVVLQEIERGITGSAQPVDYHTLGNYSTASNSARDSAVQQLAAYGSLNDLISRTTGSEVHIPLVGDLTWGDIYGLGLDQINSLTNTLLFGKGLAGTAMFAQAGTDAYVNAQERGLNDSQALLSAVFSGTAEGIGEQIGLNALWRGWEKTAGKGLKGILSFGLLQGLEGGAQEAATTAMEQAADRFFLGDYSEYSMRVAELVAEGYDQYTAETIASDEAWDEILKSGLMGALGQGGTYVAGAPIAAYRNNYAVGADIKAQGNTDVLTEWYNEISNKDKATPKTTAGVARMYNDLVNNAGKYVRNIERSEMDAAIEERYKEELGSVDTMTKQQQAIRDALIRKARGKTVSRATGREMAANAPETLADIKAKRIEPNRSKSTGASFKAAMAPALRHVPLAEAKSETSTEREPFATTEETRAKAEQRQQDITVDAAAASATVNGEAVTVQEVVVTAQGDTPAKVRVTDSDGQSREVNINDVVYNDVRVAELHSYAEDMASPELANQFIAAAGNNQDLDQLANAMNNAWDMGNAGYRIDSARKSILTKGLTEQQLTDVFNLGASARAAEIQRKADIAARRQQANANKRWTSGRIHMGDVVMDGLSDGQKRDLDIVDVVAKELGVNIQLFESKADASGYYQGERGRYDPNTNTIYLDVNAGVNKVGDSFANTTMLTTLGHEITHMLQRNDRKGYEAYRNAVIDVLERNGKNIDDLVTAKQADIPSLKERDAALDEVIADASVTMLRDSDLMDRLRELHPEEHKTFVQKVVELLDRIREAIKKAFEGAKLTAEVEAIMSDIDRLSAMWSDLAVSAAEVSGRELSNEYQTDGLVGPFDEPAQPVSAHIDQRNWKDVGDRAVNAFINDYKFSRAYMGNAADVLLADLNASVPGERYQTPDGEWIGQKRQTSDTIAYMLDNGMTWDSVRSSLEKIFQTMETGDVENDIPNTAAIKRTELMLDEMLSNGYTTLDGTKFAANAGYIEYKNALPGAIMSAIPDAAEGSVEFDSVRFSMRAPVEYQRNLVAVHNRSESSLLMDIELGGFPMPSVAIVKADQGHSKFGEVSVVLNRAAIDPKVSKRNRVYGADAWTVTFPRVRYEVDDKRFNKLYSELNMLSRTIPDFMRGEMLHFTNVMYDGVSDLSAEEIFERARNNAAMQAAYLVDMRDGFEVKKKQVQDDPGFVADRADRYEKFIREYDGDISQIMHRSLKQLYEANKELFDSIMPLKIQSPDRVRRLVSNFVSQVDAYRKYTGPTYSEIIDQEGTKQHIFDKIDSKGYAKWLHEKLDGIIKGKGIRNNKDTYTSAGKMRGFKQLYDPYTLESIVKNMRRKSGRNAEGSRNWFAASAREYGSVDEIRADSGRLEHVEAEVHTARVNELNKRLDAATYAIADKAGNGLDRYSAAEQVQEIVADNAAKKDFAAAIMRELKAEAYEVTPADVAEVVDTLTEMRDMSTEYFEAKPERSVGFDEVVAVIAPDNIDKRTRAAVQNAGMRLIEYIAGDEGSRLDALNSLEEAKFQARTMDNISERELLANVLEDAAQTETESRILDEYRQKISQLTEDQQRLDEARATIRELAFKPRSEFAEGDLQRLENARKDAKEISAYLADIDKELLKLENMAPIREVIRREGDKIKQKRDQLAKERIEQIRQTQKKATLRNTIIRRVKTLNNWLDKPTDERHVPDEFKMAVVDVLKEFANDTSVFGKDQLTRLSLEYAAIEKSESDARAFYDQYIKDSIDKLNKTIAGRRLSKLSENELIDLRIVLDSIQHMVAKSNNIWYAGRQESIDTLSAQADMELSDKQHYETRLNMSKLAKWLNEGQITAPYFFRRMGGVMGRLGNAIIEAESNYGIEVNQARVRVQEILKKYNHKKWANEKSDTLTFTTDEGATITLTREEALSLYATDKRERLNVRQSAHHLRDSGVTFKRDARELSLLGKNRKRPVEADAMKISRGDIAKINGWLTEEQKAYADAMVEYMSTDLARMGNETSRQLHGWSKFDEDYYYPYKTNSDFFNTKLDSVEAALIKNMRHAKRTVQHANNAIVITDFTATVAEHVNDMLLYHNFAVPQDSFMRVYDHHLSKSRTVKTALKTAYGLGADRYITQLMKDMYGGITRDPAQDLIGGLVGRYKKNAVLYSASVVIQQPSSLLRAFAQIDPKYFVHIPQFGGWSEAMQYAGTAVIKSIGGFDTHSGKNIVDWMTQELWADGVMDGIDKAGGALPGMADQATWGAIWNAVKQEQADQTGLDINSEELKQKAGKRFDEVIRLTQVYDSTLSRSQNMRSNSTMMKILTAFMGEPTVSYNMIYDALFTNNRGLKHTSKTFAAVMGSILLNAALKSLVTAARDDDDEAGYWEKWLKNATSDTIGNLIPFNYIPVARDVWSVMRGFTVERSDMEVFADIRTFMKVLANEKKTPEEVANSAVTLISMITGIPFKNVMRDGLAVRNVVKNWDTENRKGWAKYAAISGAIGQSLTYDIFGPKDAELLYGAALEGNSEDVARYREYMRVYKGKDDKQINTSLRTEVKNGYLDGDIDEERAIGILTDYAGMEADEAYMKVEEWEYEYSGNGDWKKTAKVTDAINSGDDKALAAAVEELVEYGGYDSPKDAAQTIASSITSTYKPLYIAASPAERKRMKVMLLDAYETVYETAGLEFYRDSRSKSIDQWLD